MASPRVSVVVPALNEERSLRVAVESVIKAAKEVGNVTIEMLIVNDGSTDGTAALSDELAAEHSCIRAIRHERNKGFGACFLSGLEAASYEWITLFPGDNVVSTQTFTDMLRHCGKAEVICAYTVNTERRTRLRCILSAIFSFVYTVTFNLHLRYINATPIYPVAKLRSMNLRCFRYSFPSEITVRLLRMGCTFIEIPGFMNPGARKSSALQLKNLLRNMAEAIFNFLSLVYDILVAHRKDYSHTPTRILPDGMHDLPLNDAQPLQNAS